jgi:hypothetical protein
MRMGALVDQHAVHRGPEVGAVVEVEAAQVELVGLAFAAMLADDQAGNGFEHFAGPVHRACLELLLRDDAGVGRLRDAELAGARGLDADRVQGLFLRCRRWRRRVQAQQGRGDCSQAAAAV